MITKDDIIRHSKELDFGDIGFTDTAPFNKQKELLMERSKEYAWTKDQGIDLLNGTDPSNTLSDGKTIIVLLEPYFRKAFPRSMEGYFGRCYLDDDRVTKDGLAKRIKAFRTFLSNAGINSKLSFSLPHRVTAARAGLGSFGKNCFFYAHNVARGGSWVLPIAIVIDKEFPPDKPTVGINCPEWCRNACISACPTRALKGNGRIDPRQCISYLTYHGDDITPMEIREPMGMFVYGCDRCQNVCPRNQPWLAQDLPLNEKVVLKAEDFSLPLLLHMDKPYFKEQVWPHMFYMGSKNLWKWKMNVARVMGNSKDKIYLPDLEKAFNENTDERVLGMIAWAMGQIGDNCALPFLNSKSLKHSGLVQEEIKLAIQTLEKPITKDA